QDIKFINSEIKRILNKEIGSVTYPLFSRDRKTAIVSYSSIGRNAVRKDREKIYVLQKGERDWQVVEVVHSK
ncbi:hypothetical protein OB13_08800, partial [Pontibacter sp. HJ8]